MDHWFREDIERIYTDHSIVVFIDESKQARFLLNALPDESRVYQAKDEIEELKTKYRIEKAGTKASKYFIYTTTPKSNLKFIREYCETHGCIEIKHLDHYIKKKVNEHLNLNINLPTEELITAAKVSIGRDRTYWMDLSHKGSTEIFDLEKELLPFLNDPVHYLRKFDADTQSVFLRKVTELIGQPHVDKPPKTLAKEVVDHLLDGLLSGTPHLVLMTVYENWLDSVSYKPSFLKYLRHYKIPAGTEVFKIHPSHPFREIDERWLTAIGKEINNKGYLAGMLPKINQRSRNKATRSLNIRFWDEVITMLTFDAAAISPLSSFEECTTYYTSHFHKLDSAIRKLYSEFLTHKEIIEPFQIYYKDKATIFLDKWFRYVESYQSTQTGMIQRILDENEEKTAIVVGDGVSWEFAQDIASGVKGDNFSLDKDYLLAGLPSETEHNMSQLYIDTGEVLATKSAREKYLDAHNPEKNLSFMDLENVNETTTSPHYLICSHKDPDKLGETYQQMALKHFDQIADLYARKITQLLQNGYKNVYLVTDHGYVLTGLLEEADKINIDMTGNVDKKERYIRSENQQPYNPDLLIEKEIKYNKYSYCYFARRLGPFKSPGVYGYSHGGLSPQETLIPFFHWTSNTSNTEMLQVSITNKSDLSDVTGNLYTLKLVGKSTSTNLFSSERKVILLFFSEGEKISESDITTITRDVEVKKEYQFGIHSEIEIRVLDAITREQLDKTIINQSSSRDMGGLI